jgi:hypothetical protein
MLYPLTTKLINASHSTRNIDTRALHVLSTSPQIYRINFDLSVDRVEGEYFPSRPSHSLTELSNEADAINRPSGENAT